MSTKDNGPADDGAAILTTGDEVGTDTTALARKRHQQGLHVFPLDHPDHQRCIGKHHPEKSPCDGKRGKHPAVTWGTWAATNTDQMILMEWRKHNGLCNIGIACGPSNLVVLDEDQHGELERWCVTYGFSLTDTYTVTTGRGRHLYFRWDHSTKRIGNSPKAMDGFKIDVRGEGGFVVAEGSQHENGDIYTGNGLDVADLPDEVAELLTAGNANGESNGTPAEQNGEHFDPDAKIGFGDRHGALVAYAGRLRNSGLDYDEVERAYHDRWLHCEQPEGQIPEAKFHSETCEYPCTWDEAKAKGWTVVSMKNDWKKVFPF